MILETPKLDTRENKLRYKYSKVKQIIQTLQSLIGEDDIIEELTIETNNSEKLIITKTDKSNQELNYNYSLKKR